jgi:hypothetical protein
VSEIDDAAWDFIAPIPHEIRADWDAKWGPKLAGFPLNLMFIGTRKPKNGSEPSQMISSVYDFDLRTFSEDPSKQHMTSRSRANSGKR